MDDPKFMNACDELGLDLWPLQWQQFRAFEENLYEANKVMNLTRVQREECWLRHFIDSLLFQDLIPWQSRVLDIGTGPGFPAWPLACARPDLSVTAIDSSGKMIRFLQRNPLPNLKPLQVRAEGWQMRDSFSTVTGRAVAPLAIQLELSAPLCKKGGQVLPMRTPAEMEQIKSDFSALGLRLSEVHERRLPETDVVRLIPVFTKVADTQKQFPRTWAEMRKHPLI